MGHFTKKYLLIFVFFFFLIPALSFIVNVYADQLDLFHWNDCPILPIREQVFKSIHLYQNQKRYDSLLIGSSRGSYIDVSKVKDSHFFNYSVSGIHIDEYYPYLKHFSKTQGVPKKIILLLDFYGTNKTVPEVEPYDIIRKSKSKFFYFISYIKLREAIVAVKMLLSKTFPLDYYDRKLIKYRIKKPENYGDDVLKGTLVYYKNTCYKDYKYNNNYPEILRKIKNDFPDSKIYVAIAPLQAELYNFTTEITQEVNYKRWIKDLVNVFGEVYDFSGINDITNDRKYFFDPAHFYPEVGYLILDRILKEEYSYRGFGIKLTQGNRIKIIDSKASLEDDLKEKSY